MTITPIRLAWLASTDMVILITAGMISGTTLGTMILGTMEAGDGAIVLGDGMAAGTDTMVGTIPGTMTIMAGAGEATMAGTTITMAAGTEAIGQATLLVVVSTVDADML